MTNGTDGGLGWLLDDLLGRLPGADRAIVLSADGLVVSRSSNMHRDDADQLAAVASGLQSLSRTTGRYFGGGSVQQTVVEMDNAFLIVTAAGTAAHLALLTTIDADMGIVAYETNLLVRQVGAYLGSQPRTEVPAGEVGRRT